MTEPLRPHVGIASARIIHIVAGGGYAVLTAAGVDLFDDTLAATDVDPGTTFSAHAASPRVQVKVLARTQAASMLECRPAASHVASELGHGGQNMRVHFQQLTEPIVPHLDNDPHDLFAFSLTHSVFQIPTLAQLKSQASRSRRLPAPRACGDPTRSSR